MGVYYLFAFIFVILWQYFNWTRLEYSKPALKWMYFGAFVLVLLSAFRSYKMCTADIQVYILEYEALVSTPIAVFFDISGESQGSFFLSWLFYNLTHLSVHWWFGAVALFYIMSLCFFFKTYSKDYLFCLLLFFAIGLFSFSLNGIKQTVSMSFAIWGWMMLDKKKILPSVVFFALSLWCHAAASIFLLSIVMYLFRNNNYYYLFLVVFSLLVAFAGTNMWRMGIDILGNEHYDIYASENLGYTYTTFIFYVVILLSALLNIRTYSNRSDIESRLMYGNAVTATILNSLCVVFSTAFRLSYYFLPFMIIMLSNCTYWETDDHKEIGNKKYKTVVLAIVLFFFFYAGRHNVYIPFWAE